MAYPRFLRSRSIKKARRTSGNLTLNSTSWANVDTGLDLVLNEVQAGDEIVYGVSFRIQGEAVDTYFDVVTLVASAAVNSFGAQGAATTGVASGIVAAWYAVASQWIGVSGASPPYTVQAGDLVDGTLTLRFRYLTSAATARTLSASATFPLDVWAMNLGPLQT